MSTTGAAGAASHSSGKWFMKYFEPSLATAVAFGSSLAAGDDGITPLIKTAGTAALWFNAPGTMNVIQGASMIINGFTLANEYVRSSTSNLKGYYRRNFGGNYVDTQQAYTMRQAAVQAMSETGMNTAQALGNEASFLHR